MRWFTHQSMAVASALALNMPPAALAGAALGAVLPDVLDQRMARLFPHPQKAFNRLHRGPTHWFGWYMLLFLLLLGMGPATLPAQWGNLALRTEFWNTALGLAFGALSHVALDMLTPQGIPLHPFSRQRKFSLKVCSTGSLGEYLFLAAGLGCIVLLAPGHWESIVRVLRHYL